MALPTSPRTNRNLPHLGVSSPYRTEEADSGISDVDTVTRTLGRVNSPTVLVGHSYGGTLITHVGMDERVAALVYLSALARDETETSQSEQDKFPERTFSITSRSRTDASGCAQTVSSASPETSPRKSRESSPPPRSCQYQTCFSQKMEGIAWKSKPSWYVVAKDDHTVNPELERSAAKRMNATVTEVESSRVPMLSHPDVVLDVIRQAASSF